MSNVPCHVKTNLSSFRRIAIGTWQTEYDPSVYGTLEIPMEEASRYLDAYREKTGKKLTYTHLVVKAVAKALAACPDANAILRFNRIYLRDQVDVFMQVVMQDPETGEIDLSGIKIERADQMPLAEIVDQVEKKADLVRKRKDPSLEKTRGTFRWMPSFLLNAFLKILSVLMYKLNLNMTWAGLPKDPFGSVMVTSIGSLGLDQAFVPLVPYSCVPILVAAGAVREVPAVIDGQIRPCKMIKLNATFDHRVIDGKHAAILSEVVRRTLGNPFKELDLLDAQPAAAAAPAATPASSAPATPPAAPPAA